MFTGIIETTGIVKRVTTDKSNLKIFIEAPFIREIKIDQSISHNGICLTVDGIEDAAYSITAIEETLLKTYLRHIKEGDLINLERSMLMNGRLDGHLVYGHVDQTAICIDIAEQNGSTVFTFNYDATKGNITIEKGSVCVNGVSLTVVNSRNGAFSVAIIPYTLENTNFKYLQKGSVVNLEFDVIGKYVARYLQQMIKK
jgi:riboflavin synthase